MALLLHISIAFLSLGFTLFVFFRPTNARLQASFALIAGTLASGTFLLVTKPSHMLETCVMGLFYVGVTTLGTVAARQKLAAQDVRHDR
jgi:hypothetical protein